MSRGGGPASQTSGVISRRALLWGGAGTAGAAVATAAIADESAFRLRRALGWLPDPYLPDAPPGRVRVEQVRSAAMDGEVDLFTAVPAGHGDGRGLPVVVVLHGASASAAGLPGLGLPRFVSAVVAAGAPPFVLAGTDDGPAGWVPAGGADPQRMVVEELPGWLSARGFDAGRRALWGWSRGGYGALRLLLAHPGWAEAAVLFSPAVSVGDPSLADLSALAGTPLGVWCGEDDALVAAVRDLVARLPEAPETGGYGDGGHTRYYWNERTETALAWAAGRLADAGRRA